MEQEIEGDTIRPLRKRIGLTPRQLADRLNVDQGTASRWERGKESPRPTRAAILRDLLLRDDDRPVMLRSRAFVRHDFMPATFLDHPLRLTALSASAAAH